MNITDESRIIKFDREDPEWRANWLVSRSGRIMGSKLKPLTSKPKSGALPAGQYDLIAERVCQADNNGFGSSMERGHELEGEAMELFAENEGVEVISEPSILISDFSEYVANSPDGLIIKDGVITAGLEVKSLGAGKHVQTIYENKIPSDYWLQVIQYFIVCETIEKVYYISYDPRFTAHPIHVIETSREDVKDDIEFYKNFQIETLEKINSIVEKLTF